MLKTGRLERIFGAVAVIALSVFLTGGAGAQRERPDLTVKDIKFRSSRSNLLCQGNGNHFQIFIKSTAGVPAGKLIRVQTQFTQEGVSERRFHRTTLESKNAGTQKIEINDFDIPNRGRLEMRVAVDAANEIEEADETNNTKTLTFDVQEECGQPR